MTERGSEQRIELRIPEDDLILPFQAEHADVLEPFDRRHTVAAHHLVELDHRLAGMGLHRDAASWMRPR